jgi:Flp pilus assembly protein CpaB
VAVGAGNGRASSPSQQHGQHQVGRVAGLPSGRAVVGGFLVALAAIGVYAAYRGASSGPSHRFIVASRDIAPGSTLSTADLTLVAVDLPDGAAARAFGDTRALVGRIAVAPVTKGELVQASAVADRSAADARFQVSLPLDRSRALDGTLAAGEKVDVIVTYTGTEAARTLVVARRAEVVRVSVPSRGGISGGGDLVVVLALPNEDEVLAVTHGAQAGKVTLVRATGAGAEGLSGADSYRPPAGSG